MLTYDPVAGLRHYPISMARFGQNPYGENLYRIVFSASRRHLVCGEWPDGSNKAAYVRRYPAVGDQWIMERWLPAAEYAKMSREQWDREMLILGPYPERGEYEICHVFETCSIEDSNLEKLVAWIEMGRKTSFFETQTFHREDAAREKKAIGDQQEAMIKNWLPAFGTAPISGYGGGRSMKSAPIMKTAEELGLPMQGGQFRTKPGKPNKFQVPLEVA